MTKVFAAALLATTVAVSNAAIAGPTESLTAVFTTPDGGVTVNGYDQQILVDVSGIGQSLGNCQNDAFYVLLGCQLVQDGRYYQLSFGTSPLVIFNPDQDAINFIVGGLPAYNPTHDYSFILNTGATVLTQLHFGVSDGEFDDNSGAYQITVAQLGVSEVPEPLTLALFGAGLVGMAAVGRRKKRTS